ncbi:(2Fe-2S) ferredoxin domain-containing protein [Methylobacterium sp. ID0610]|uniref:(2Fe-2S) ferredoxin domain-containing protein n=1 Tax=Methylobacterium carpenticola TaxID=3344827 RepID=UPI00367DC790
MSGIGDAQGRRPKAASAPWNDLVVVCAKCAKRQGSGGKAVRKDLKRAFKRTRPDRKVRVVETGCLGLCPKRSLTFATAASLRAGRLVVIDPATEAEAMAQVLVPESAS